MLFNTFYFLCNFINISLSNLIFLKKKKTNKPKNFYILYYLKKKKILLLDFFILNNLIFFLFNIKKKNLNDGFSHQNKLILHSYYDFKNDLSLTKYFLNKKNIVKNNSNSASKSILFKVQSFLKNILKTNFNLLNLLFLRKFRVFNKGRYSRNRQFYRTGVYWCIYINIIAVVGIYFWFYKITMNYNYFWIILYIFFLCLIMSRIINFVSFNKIESILKWNLMIINNLKFYIIFFFFKNNSIFKKILILLK